MSNTTDAGGSPPGGESERYARGWEKLREIHREAGEQVLATLAEIAPDFARYLIEFPFGDIYTRPQLDLKSREIAVIASLTTQGHAAPQLKVHIQAALNAGCTRQEVLEVIMQMAVYAAFPPHSTACWWRRRHSPNPTPPAADRGCARRLRPARGPCAAGGRAGLPGTR